MIAMRTGIQLQRYDCCINSCLSYAMYPTDTVCNICGHPRWKPSKDLEGGSKTDPVSAKEAFAQHVYIPVAHRLRLWWSNAVKAETMIHYRNLAVDDPFSDFWSGGLYKDLRTQNTSGGSFFSRDTDVAFFLSTDGVKVFKSRRAFYIWPILLVSSTAQTEIFSPKLISASFS
jgi:hypothetical protein